MPNLDTISAIIEAEVADLGLSLVRIAWLATGGQEGPEPVLQVMAERADTRQLVIEDCAALSHRLSDHFDALEADGRDPFDVAYRLEVSSPGIDRPLTRLSDYSDWVGHEARIEIEGDIGGQKKFRGDLGGLDGETILLVDREQREHRLPFEQITHAKLVLTDRLITATAPINSDGVDAVEEENINEIDA